MVDITKLDMTDIWASGGDKIAPLPDKIAQGWLVEAVPRQTWNWFENRQDQNIAYMLQKGIPEWDATTEYQINKSYVQRNGDVYRAIATNVNSDPVSLVSWVKAFQDYTVASKALGSLTPVAGAIPFFISGVNASTFQTTAYCRAMLNLADSAAVRSYISAQASNTNLTALSGVAAGINVLPYFDSTTTMGQTTLTAFARSLLDDPDAATARTTLGVYSTAQVDTAISDSAATKQPLDATLTALAGLTTATDTINYWTGVDTTLTTALTPFARTLLDDIDAATARATLGVYSSAQVDASKQPLDATLTALAGLATGANQLAYSTGTDTFAQTPLTAFARTILDDADAASVRTTIGAQTLDATLTALAGVTTAANQLIYATGVDTFAMTSLTAFARTLLDDADAAAGRATLGLGTSAVRNTTSTGNVIAEDTPTGAAQLTKGTTAQRPAGLAGLLRFNTDTNRFEGYNSTAWGSLGGATGGGNDDAFYENTTTITTSYTISAGKNAGSFGPITVADGVTVTIPTGSTWSIV